MFLEKDFLANIKIEAETIQLSQPRFFVWIGLKWKCEIQGRGDFIIMNYYTLIESLIGRIELSNQEIQKYENYKKGREGEDKFISILKSINHVEYIYNLQLKNNQYYQYDFIVITDKVIYQFEIKNYYGAYEFKDGNLIGQNGFIIKYPSAQLERNEYYLEHIITKLNIQRIVKSYLVFTNDKFTLSGDTNDDLFILPTQIKKINQLIQNNEPQNNYLIKTTLQTLHDPFEDEFNQYPIYKFENVKPGIRCTYCMNIIERSLENKQKMITCHNCYTTVSRKELILKTLEELLCIKGAPFTMREARKWCNGVHRNTLLYIMKGHFKVKLKNKTKVYY